MEYNIPFEVSKQEYDILRTKMAGVLAHRHDKEENKYYVKLLMEQYKPIIESFLFNWRMVLNK